MMYGLFWIACGLAGWGFGPFVLLVCDDWLGRPPVWWGAGWLLHAIEEPESLILAQSERWRHA